MIDKRPMTDREKYAAKTLAGCTFQVASYNKRFARDLAGIATMPDPQITERQAANLWRLVYRYRRQIRDRELVAESERLKPVEQKPMNPEDRQKLEAWSEATKSPEPRPGPEQLPLMEQK